MTNLIRRSCFWWVLFFSLISLASQAIPLTTEPGPLDWGKHWSYWEEQSPDTDYHKVLNLARSGQFTENPGETLNFGFNPLAHWLYLPIENSDPTPKNWILEFPYPPLDYIDFYFIDANGKVIHQRSGDRLPFSSRFFSHPNPNFSLPIAPQSKAELLIRVQTDGVAQIPTTLWEQTTFLLKARTDYAVMAAYLAIVLMLVIYNLAICITVRDGSHFFYALFIFLYALSIYTLRGYAHAYLWPEATSWANYAVLVFPGLTTIAMLFFSRQFLETQQYLPRLDSFLLFIGGVAVIQLITIPFSYSLANHLTYFNLLTMTGGVLCAGWHRLRQKMPGSVYFIAAWAALFIGVSVYYAKQLRLLPVNLLTEYSVMLGSTIKIILLSFALIDRYRSAREEAQQAEQTAKAELEQEVRRRTEDLRQAKESLETINERLQKLNETDALTGVKNRRFFDDRLEEEWRRCRRDEKPIALILIDLDHFKKINDTYGHHVGDICLIVTTKRIQQLLKRVGDELARYGGEEFAVVLPNTDAKGAAFVAEAIRRAIAAQPIQHADLTDPLPLTGSLGVAVAIPKNSTLTSLVESADQALYQAKAQGRNQVVVHSE